jgi:hypothetical protein
MAEAGQGEVSRESICGIGLFCFNRSSISLRKASCMSSDIRPEWKRYTVIAFLALLPIWSTVGFYFVAQYYRGMATGSKVSKRSDERFIKRFKGAIPIEPTERWQGKIAVESLQNLAPPERFLADDKKFEKVWKAWRPEDEVPPVNFEEEIVIVATASGPNTLRMNLQLGDNGDLQFDPMSTLVGGPGFGYLMLKVSREEVLTVNGTPLMGKSAEHP